jgi:hypothetical protein
VVNTGRLVAPIEIPEEIQEESIGSFDFGGVEGGIEGGVEGGVEVAFSVVFSVVLWASKARTSKMPSGWPRSRHPSWSEG